MIRPGRLTLDYLEGKRARYMPPFRMYLVLSVIFFVVAFFLAAALVAAPAAAATDTSTGAFDLLWNDCFTGPGEEVPDWIGTVDFDGTVYDILFFNVGTGRPPTLPPLEPPMISASESPSINCMA